MCWAAGIESWLLANPWAASSVLLFLAGGFPARGFPGDLLAFLLGLGFAVGLAAVARGFFGAPLLGLFLVELPAGGSSSDALVTACHGSRLLGEKSWSHAAMRQTAALAKRAPAGWSQCPCSHRQIVNPNHIPDVIDDYYDLRFFMCQWT